MKDRIRICDRFSAADDDGSVRRDAGGEPQKRGAFILAHKSQPSNDNVESFIGNEGVGIRGDKTRPIATARYCCSPLGYLDGIRRSIDPDNQAGRTNQLRDRERCIAGAALEIENPHAALYAGPPQDVFGKLQHGGYPKSRWTHFNSGITQLGRRRVCSYYQHIELVHELTHWFSPSTGVSPGRLRSRTIQRRRQRRHSRRPCF